MFFLFFLTIYRPNEHAFANVECISEQFNVAIAAYFPLAVVLYALLLGFIFWLGLPTYVDIAEKGRERREARGTESTICQRRRYNQKKYVLQSIIARRGQLWAEGGAPPVACSVETGCNTFTPTNNSNARLSSFPSRKNLEVGYCCIGGS